MFQSVRDDQFKISENELIHLPTRARFTRFPGKCVVRHVFWNDAGQYPEFRKLDIFTAATAIIESGVMDKIGNSGPKPDIAPNVDPQPAPTPSENPKHDEPPGSPAPMTEPPSTPEPLGEPPTSPQEIE
jgi:hypothetical protein